MTLYFYADFYLILNFILNGFLVSATALLRQKKGRYARFFLLSAFHAALSAGYTYLLWGRGIWLYIAAFAQIGAFLAAAYGFEGFFSWLADELCFLALSFFTGGFVNACKSALLSCRMVKSVSPLLMTSCVVLGLSAVCFLFRGELAALRIRRKTTERVTVSHRGHCAEVLALYDTGNQLISPYTGEGVVIVSKELAAALCLSSGQNPVLIPFSSIGGSGLLEAYRLECLQTKESCNRQVLAAVSSELDGRKGIQMILNSA